MFGNLHNRLCRFAVLTYRVFRDLRGIPNVKSVAELMRYCATLKEKFSFRAAIMSITYYRSNI